MSVLDEIQVTDTGDVEVRIIPSDELSTEPDVLVTYAKGSPPGHLVCERYLRAIAHKHNLRGTIVTVVHSRDERYTVHTSAGECLEVEGAADERSLAALEGIVDLVERSAFPRPTSARPRLRTAPPSPSRHKSTR